MVVVISQRADVLRQRCDQSLLVCRGQVSQRIGDLAGSKGVDLAPQLLAVFGEVQLGRSGVIGAGAAFDQPGRFQPGDLAAGAGFVQPQTLGQVARLDAGRTGNLQDRVHRGRRQVALGQRVAHEA